MIELSKMTTEELQAEFVELAPKLAEISDRRILLAAEIERRAKQATARTRLSALDEGEKEALRQELAK